jgi:DNA (cytosine-5)-methyltransferase 1
VLDLFSGSGGAAVGYRLAGYRVICIDSDLRHAKALAWLGIEFHCLDWAEGLRRFGHLAVLVHASPPCQHYSKASTCRPGLAAKYPDLVGPVRRALVKLGKPFVIENVPGAPLRDPIVLCGTMFGLGAHFPPHGRVELQRHRLFESPLPIAAPGPCDHQVTAIRIFGHGRPGNSHLTGPGYAQASREAMGIGWMSREALDEAIPPAYTEHIGRQASGPLGLKVVATEHHEREHLADPVPLRVLLVQFVHGPYVSRADLVQIGGEHAAPDH